MPRRLHASSIGLAALIGIVATQAMAQPSIGGPASADRLRDRHANLFFLAGNDAVQKDLAMTDEQKVKLTSFMEEYGKARRELSLQAFGPDPFALSNEAREKAEVEFGGKNQKLEDEKKPALVAMFTADQMTRLGQISLQMKGSHALQENDIRAKLEITDQQQKTLAEISTDFIEKEKALRQSGEASSKWGRKASSSRKSVTRR